MRLRNSIELRKINIVITSAPNNGEKTSQPKVEDPGNDESSVEPEFVPRELSSKFNYFLVFLIASGTY